MDSEVRNLLAVVLQHLQNIKESQKDQKKKQSETEEHLHNIQKELLEKLDQEKVFMRDELQNAQKEILSLLKETKANYERQIQTILTSGQGSDLPKIPGDAVTGRTDEHVSDTSPKEVVDIRDQRLHDMIKSKFERLNQCLKTTLPKHQQNLDSQLLMNTEHISARLHESIEDFKKTEAQLFVHTTRMETTLDNIDASNKALETRVSSIEEKLTAAQQTTQQHVKDGVMYAVSELRNSTVAYLKTFFTKKSLVCLLLFSAVGLSVWYRTEGLASVKSQMIQQMDNTKADLVSVTSDATQHIMDKLDNIGFSPWHVPHKEYTKHMEHIKAELASLKRVRTQNIHDTLSYTKDEWHNVIKSEEFAKSLENIRSELVSMTKEKTQQILDELRRTGDKLCNVKSDEFGKSLEDTKSEVVSLSKIMTQQILNELQIRDDKLFNASSKEFEKHLENSKSELITATKAGTQEILKELRNTINKSENANKREEYANRLEEIKIEFVSVIEKMMKHIGDEQLESSNYIAMVLTCVENMSFYFPILLLFLAALFIWSSRQTRGKINSIIEETKINIISATNMTESEIISATKMTKCEIISATERTKSDIISFTEKENQLLRDMTAGPLPPRSTYICDFYVENFQQLVRSGTTVSSLPWHINQFSTSVSGRVYFNNETSDMTVWLNYGRHPREVELEPKSQGMCNVKVTVTDTSGELPDHDVGEITWTHNEENNRDNNYWGREVGVVSCDELLERGFAVKEGYINGALLIRYEMTV